MERLGFNIELRVESSDFNRRHSGVVARDVVVFSRLKLGESVEAAAVFFAGNIKLDGGDGAGWISLVQMLRLVTPRRKTYDLETMLECRPV